MNDDADAAIQRERAATSDDARFAGAPDGMHVSGGLCVHGPECSGTGPDCAPDEDYYRTQWLNARRYMKVLEAARDGLEAEVRRLNDQLDTRAISGDEAADPPEAPVWMSAEAAYGWSCGWSAGYRAARQLDGSADDR